MNKARAEIENTLKDRVMVPGFFDTGSAVDGTQPGRLTARASGAPGSQTREALDKE